MEYRVYKIIFMLYVGESMDDKPKDSSEFTVERDLELLGVCVLLNQ